MVDKGSEFFNRSKKSFLLNNDTEMYSMDNDGKSVVVAKRFIRTLKNKIYRYMTSVSKIVCINTLGDIVNKYNNMYHSINKVKPVHEKPNTYIDSTKKLIIKILNLKLVISEYQNIKTFLRKVTLQIGLKKFL